MDKVLRTIEDLSKRVMLIKGETKLHMLLAYGKILSMNDRVLGLYFSDEWEFEAIKSLKEDVKRRGIHLDSLVKGGKMIMALNVDLNPDKTSFFQKFSNPEQYSDVDTVLSVWDKLLSNLPDLKYMCGSYGLTDVFSYAYKLQQGEVIKSEDNPMFKDEYDTKQARLQALVKVSEEMQSYLSGKVKGQPEAIRALSQGFFQSQFLREGGNAKGIGGAFLFVGPGGVGKTHLATKMAKFLRYPFLHLDMSEYTDDTGLSKLLGGDGTIVGSDRGLLTGYVEDHIRCVVLFDEIEKTSKDIMYRLLRILDNGIYKDGYNKHNVNFADAIFVFTSRSGKYLYERREENFAAMPASAIKKTLLEDKDAYGDSRIPPEFISRFTEGSLVAFNYLGVNDLISIIDKELDDIATEIQEVYDYNVEIDKRLSPMVLYSHNMLTDARNVITQSVMMIKNELQELVRNTMSDPKVLDNIKNISMKVDVSDEDEVIKQLFEHNLPIDFIFFGDENALDNTDFCGECNGHTVGSIDEMKECIGKYDISFVIVDPFYGLEEDKQDYLSLDDRRSVGISAFEELREKVPQLPVYLVDPGTVSDKDKVIFHTRGARDFIVYKDANDLSYVIRDINEMIYYQNKIDELSGRGRILTYNTSQKITDSGKSAEIVFYGFRTKIAADLGENSMFLKENDRPKDRMADIIGAESAKEELTYFIEYLKNPKKFMIKNIKPPKGILLYGPPGTGKTMLARAMAGESDVTFFPTTASSFQDKYFGESEKKVRDLFSIARKFAPSIVFIDEIDAIGKERQGTSSTQATESLLNTLLTEMDGFDTNSSRPVFVVAATNFNVDNDQLNTPVKIDPALVRRFDNKIYVDLPKEEERERYLKILVKEAEADNISDDAIHNVADRTTGQSLAILKNVVSLMLRNCNRKESSPTDNDLLTALEEYMYGEKKEWNESYYKAVAIHESGHAYICSLSGEKPSYITIVSRGDFGGYMQRSDKEDVPVQTKEALLWKIRTALAGRAAEEVFFGEEGINTGISSDLQQATNLVFSMICRYGMDENRIVSLDPTTVLQSDMGRELMKRSEEILSEEMTKTKELIREGKKMIEELADYLIRNNQATEVEIMNILKGE